MPNDSPSDSFIAYIAEDTPLSNKLRDKWLYQLGKNGHWALFSKYYQPSKETSLQCYHSLAMVKLGQTKEGLTAFKPLFMTGDDLSSSCNSVFQSLYEQKLIPSDWLTERAKLALGKRDYPLAKYLVAKAHLKNPYEKRLLEIIHRQPTRISTLEPSDLHSHYYLYGLKRLVSSNPKKAIELWRKAKQENRLSEKQSHAFMAHLALYKAIRNKNDTNTWFEKVSPDAYTNALMDWQIRYSLRRQDWTRVKKLILHTDYQNDIAWSYWLARAEEALGNEDAAKELYQKVAKERHYYGFLASSRLHTPFSLQEEPAVSAEDIAMSHAPILEKIKSLYESNHTLEASRLSNDFMVALSKHKRSSFVAWLEQKLHWTGKSVYLSGDDTLSNQISLRFPLSHQKLVNKYAANYNIPEAFVFAIIRQESAFRHDVTSPVGAHGLMQVMPKTAKHVARRARLSYGSSKDLFKPQKNIEIGVAYLSQLAKQFDDNPIFMVAAYNAGPRQVHRWQKRFPLKNQENIDIWIETLPWAETRNYLKAVMAFYAVYLHRLNQTSNLHAFLKQDLHYDPKQKDPRLVNQSPEQTQKVSPMTQSWIHPQHPLPLHQSDILTSLYPHMLHYH